VEQAVEQAERGAPHDRDPLDAREGIVGPHQSLPEVCFVGIGGVGTSGGEYAPLGEVPQRVGRPLVSEPHVGGHDPGAKGIQIRDHGGAHANTGDRR